MADVQSHAQSCADISEKFVCSLRGKVLGNDMLLVQFKSPSTRRENWRRVRPPAGPPSGMLDPMTRYHSGPHNLTHHHRLHEPCKMWLCVDMQAPAPLGSEKEKIKKRFDLSNILSVATDEWFYNESKSLLKDTCQSQCHHCSLQLEPSSLPKHTSTSANSTGLL